MITEATGLTLIPENIPQELTERPQWVCWRYEERDEKLTKVPYTPYTAIRASSSDLMDWKTFDEAVDAHRGSESDSTRPYDGIGFVFSSADPYVGIDLDHCRDPETGELAGWAREILERVPETYVEVSPSGAGVHIIVEGSVRGGGIRKGNVEMYSRGRFFTITGRAL